MLSKSDFNKLSKNGQKKVRSASVRGSGAYTYDKKKQPFGHYGEKIGKYIGSAFNVPFARQLGAYGGHAIGKMFGSGSYYNARGKYIPSYQGAHKIIKGSGAYYNSPKKVLTNSTSPPSFGTNRTIIRHREFIGNIQGSTAYEINTWNVNPGDESTFPWLSAISSNYEKYRPIGIIFEFKSTSANALNSINTALGTVMMCPRYNAVSQSTPQSKMEMLQIENCVSVCPAESAMCGIECAKNYNPLGVLYNRTGGVVPTGSEQLYDFCDFYLATEGMQAIAVIGELWVTYEIELLTPILGAGQVGYDINLFHGGGTSLLTSAQWAGANFAAYPDANSNMSMTWDSTLGRMYFPRNLTTGNYLITLAWYGTSTAYTLPVPTGTPSTTGLSVLNYFTSNTIQPGTAINPQNLTATGTRMTITFAVSLEWDVIATTPSYFTLVGGTYPASMVMFEMSVNQIPDNA